MPRVIKIGLVAPFEGRYRYVGYDAIYAARLAVREINAAGGVAGWHLELVAYDDRADPGMARAAARNLVIAPDVVAAIGHYRQESIVAAGDVYAEAALPLLVIGGWFTGTDAPVWHLMPSPERVAAAAEWHDAGWTGMLVGGIDVAAPDFAGVAGTDVRFVAPYPLPQDVVGLEAWCAAYRAVGPHVPDPGLYALPTYEAVYVLAEAIAAAVEDAGRPSRTGVGVALTAVRRTGHLGDIGWDDAGYWRDAPLYLYAREASRVWLVERMED